MDGNRINPLAYKYKYKIKACSQPGGTQNPICALEEKKKRGWIMSTDGQDQEQQVIKKKLKMDKNLPRLFQWVIASSASSALTIGERSKKMKLSRGGEWIKLVYLPSLFIGTAACGARVACIHACNNSWAVCGVFPWWLSVVMLAGVYVAVVFLAMGHLALFLPEAPSGALEALYDVG